MKKISNNMYACCVRNSEQIYETDMRHVLMSVFLCVGSICWRDGKTTCRYECGKSLDII